MLSLARRSCSCRPTVWLLSQPKRFRSIPVLEALLSAREKLWISYQGRDPYDLTELPPSSVVTELFPLIGKRRTTAAYPQPSYHPPTSFSIQVTPTFTLPQGNMVIDLADVARLSRSALRHYFHFNNVNIETTDQVFYEGNLLMTPLQKAVIRKEALRMPKETLIRKGHREGRIPAGIWGTLAYMQITDEVGESETKEVIPPFIFNPFRFSMNSSLTVTFVGSLDGVVADGLCTTAENTIKGAALSWPLFLLLNAYDRSKRTLCFASKNSSQIKKELFFDDPTPFLEAFLEYFFFTKEHPFPMIADWVEGVLQKDLKKIRHTPLYDPVLKWQSLGKKGMDFERVIEGCFFPELRKSIERWLMRGFNVFDPTLNLKKNYFLEASAGTGKTFTIENIVVPFFKRV